MNQIDLNTLLEKYLSRNCSPEEIILLESWYLSQSAERQLPSPSEEELHKYKQSIWTGIQQSQQNQKNQLETAPAPNKLKRLSPALLAAVAVLLLLLSFGGYLLLQQQPPILKSPQAKTQQDLLPGSNKAVLILSNGKQINLSGQKLVSYKKDPPYSENGSGYNTIRTPNGGQWPAIELPDGTKVFLDAASSITFPVVFAKERKVSITGQAYFEVIHQSDRPFLISVKGLTIEDLGTAFNVNAYDDEAAVKTTLVEGLVSIANNKQKVMLIPGQQALAAAGTETIITRNANMEEVMAWKNGLFQFNRTPMEGVMRQIARWYDVEVIYKNDVSRISFTGNLPRNLKASRLLEILSITGLDFKIKDNKIIVSAL